MKRKANNYTGEIKPGDFNLTDISAYFLHTKKKGGDNLLSGQTYSDLGVEELFTFADRTTSGIGQQYLYHTLRTIPLAKGEIGKNEDVINHLKTDANFRGRLAKALFRLRDTEVYSIVRLMADEHPVASGKTKIAFTILKFLPALFLLLYLFAHITACGMLFLVAIILNAVIHYAFKPKSLDYIHSVPQLIKLVVRPDLLGLGGGRVVYFCG